MYHKKLNQIQLKNKKYKKKVKKKTEMKIRTSKKKDG